MRNKIVTAAEAVALIQDGDTIATSGFVGIGVPDDLLAALQARFGAEDAPRGLTLLFAAGQGDGKERGLNRLAGDGLLRRAIGGHWGLIPRVGQLALEDRIEGYNLPQGVISQMYRDVAAGKPGTVTRVGLRTFVDPRLEGGRINGVTTEELVRVIDIGGEEFLFYKAHPIDVALLRATTADADGNLTMEREALTLDNLAMAMAARNSGGLVIAQVERVAAAGSLHPRQVVVPGVLVDCVVVADPSNHAQTYRTHYSPAFSGELRVPLEGMAPLQLDERKVIARRAAMELPVNGVVNLGIGMPEGVASVANEERILDLITLTAEPGVIGGMPASGLDFGAAVNTHAVIAQNQQFDFYDGGGLDLACLGMAEAGAAGDVNVSRFGSRLAGAGGFINISQNARRVVFMGTFTAGGLDVCVEEGRLRIRQEGRSRKFRRAVQQVTFSGPYAAERGREVLYVTERCVFRLTPDGLELTEVAPGVDVERDILAQMGFRPLIRSPKPMHLCIFVPEPMDLRSGLLDLRLPDRIAYDPERSLLFLNFERMHVRDLEDVRAVRVAVEERCRAIGRRVGVVVNYDGFRIEDAAADAYAEMVREVAEAHYTKVSRYTTSAFLRHKLSRVLTREVAPHIFETKAEARAFHEAAGDHGS
jgi:propionate CoA-transferase